MLVRLCRLEGVQFSRVNNIFLMTKKGRDPRILKSFNDIFKFATWGKSIKRKPASSKGSSPSSNRANGGWSTRRRDYLYRGKIVCSKDIAKLVPSISPPNIRGRLSMGCDAAGNVDTVVDRMIAKYGMTKSQEDRLNIVGNAAEDLRLEIVKKMTDTTKQERISQVTEL